MTDRVTVFEAAVQTCLVCSGEFRLTPQNHDGRGPVCPDCGALC